MLLHVIHTEIGERQYFFEDISLEEKRETEKIKFIVHKKAETQFRRQRFRIGSMNEIILNISKKFWILFKLWRYMLRTPFFPVLKRDKV